MLDVGLGVRLLTPRTLSPNAGTGQGVKVRMCERSLIRV